MEPEFENLLYAAAPSVFPPYDYGSAKGIRVSIDTDSGWFPLLFRLVTALEAYNRRHRWRRLLFWRRWAPVTASQVKEKLGTLRFYYDGGGWEATQALVAPVEAATATTCEGCSAPGRLRRGGWLKTLCDECNKHYFS